MEQIFRVLDFNVYNQKVSSDCSSSDEETTSNVYEDHNEFLIQMFGVNEEGKTCSIMVEGFKPFFYLLVDDKWNINMKDSFINHLKMKMGKYYKNSIDLEKSIIIKRKKLYGFDAGKEYKFIKLEFNNINAFNKAKNLWYTEYDKDNYELGHKLKKNGYSYNNTDIKLYEANIPPLLRFFHINDISPSGWIALPNNKIKKTKDCKKTTCDFEFSINYKYVIALNDKESRVPYKIMSFDIEASSSHGDFPIPIKSYKKLSTNIIEYFENYEGEMTKDKCKTILSKIILCAFGYDSMYGIDIVYPKNKLITKKEIENICDKWLLSSVRNYIRNKYYDGMTTLETMFHKNGDDDINEIDEIDEGESKNGTYNFSKYLKPYNDKKATIIDILCDKKFERDNRLSELNISLNTYFPRLEGDKVTFIGSTFMNYGEAEPYMNHCIVLNTCSEVKSCILENYDTEKDVLLAWQKLVERENPDIIIGYNIFGFDYEFMFRRAEENNCVEEFLKLSRNKDEICGKKDRETGKYNIEESSIKIASGDHELKFIKMNGRLQVDLYNFYRRETNLSSYKLDYVAGHFIGDYIKKINKYSDSDCSEIYTKNLTGLSEGSYIHIEEIGHSVDYYEPNGVNKFKVIFVNKNDFSFKIDKLIEPDMSKKVRWCLAKDDVTPKDIFRMTNGSSMDRAIIAKYCIQDCNLVNYLFNKTDILTGFIEMSRICSVPINFLVMRGQGIKLTSFIAKKCRAKRTLIPVIEKGNLDEGFEGAIVLEPKCDLYLDNPVACVDYASLYPSSMISENLSHDSKVWTKEYDLAGNLIQETGEKDIHGNFVYDNLLNYDYVNCTYDTYVYVRKTPLSAPDKIKSGMKICRFAQFKEGKAIMPSILEDLLKARKATRKLIPGEKDEFMKQVLEQRQLGYKLTANSLYGQCGAKTSTFYEKDIAACTTATGRLLLIYAKKIIEECYGDKICNTVAHGPVLTKAEYIYGDSVANYTPVYVKINNNFDILTIEQLAERYGENKWIVCKEEFKQEKEYCELHNIETWSEKGWTKLYRVIRHKLASHKKMLRVTTNTGLVDVTDDHSLIQLNGKEISPKNVSIGMELLHNSLPKSICEDDTTNENNDIKISYSNHGEIILSNNILKSDRKTRKTLLNKIIGTNMITDDFVVINEIKQISASLIYWLAQSLDYTVSIRYGMYLKDQNNICNGYIINIYNTKPVYNPNAIKDICEIKYAGYVYDLTTENHHFAAGIGNMIVHNTDSVFFTFNLQTPEGKPIRGKEALEITIELAQEAGHLASSFLKDPHDLEYEKTFMPFCLLSKKRYVGMLYEKDANECKRKEMGIVLKRRDNAPIVKDIYGGIIDILMKQKDIQKAIDFLKSSLQNIIDEKFSIDKLIITKSLRTGYKNPKSIAHKVLSDRITQRDPGNKPSSGDRIPFVYINCTNKKALQGEKIETPTFIKDNNLKIDYSFYITNQIMKPVQQLFALVLEKIWEMQNKKSKISRFNKDVEILKKNTPFDKFENKLEQLKNKEVKILLFDEYLRVTDNQKNKLQSITMFFKK